LVLLQTPTKTLKEVLKQTLTPLLPAYVALLMKLVHTFYNMSVELDSNQQVAKGPNHGFNTDWHIPQDPHELGRSRRRHAGPSTRPEQSIGSGIHEVYNAKSHAPQEPPPDAHIG